VRWLCGTDLPTAPILDRNATARPLGQQICCTCRRSGAPGDSLRATTSAPETRLRSGLNLDNKTQPCKLPVMILWMGALPAATHEAMTEPCAMGLGQQLARRSLLKWHGSRQSNRHSPMAEGHQLHCGRSVWILIQLQPALLRNSHRPVVHLPAGACGAADIGQTMQWKHSL